jgi:hypothetical protein
MAKNDTFEQERCCRPCGICAGASIGGQDGVHAVPNSLVDDRQVFGLVPLLFVAKFVASKVMLRNHTQVGNYVRWGVTSLNTNNGQQICGRGNLPFPNGADYSLWLMPTYVRQEDGHLRGMMLCMLWLHQDRPYSDQTIVDNVLGQSNKRFLLVRTQYSSETEGAQVAFDITGPWR